MYLDVTGTNVISALPTWKIQRWPYAAEMVITVIAIQRTFSYIHVLRLNLPLCFEPAHIQHRTKPTKFMKRGKYSLLVKCLCMHPNGA